jgi:hypothetical protein
VLEPVAAGGVVLDGDAEFGECQVRPHLDVLEERASNSDRVQRRRQRQPREQVRPHLRFDG